MAFRPLVLSLLLLIVAFPTFAQNYRGTIRGRVTDTQKAVVPNTTVELTQLDTGELRKLVTNRRGEYVFSLVKPGSYQLTVEQKGFTKYAANLDVSVNQDFRLDVELSAQARVYTVDVKTTNSLKQDSPSHGAVIDNFQVTGLPLDGRNFLELSLLVPGASPAAQGSAGSVRGDFAFNINGTREDANNFLLDGVYNVDPKLNTFGVKPPVDAIREFEVAASTYDASFGRSAGAQVNVVLKSGGNALHGTVYEFFRNKAFDARNFFAPHNEPAPQYQRNQFGGSLGGRLIENKTFFFADYEGTRLREGITRVTNVPTLAERQGNFSASLLPKPVIPQGQPGAGFPFPGNTLPAPFINPVGAKIAALYPLPNRATPFANFVSSPTQRDRNDLFDVRIDHQINNKSQFAARYSFNDRLLFEPFAGPTFAQIPGYGNDVPRRGQNLMFSETHIFSSAFVNDLRVAFSRTASSVTQEGNGVSINQQVGMPELSRNPRDFGLSFITLTGYSPIGHEYNSPQFSATNTYQLLDTATWSRGAHLVKFGADIRKIEQNAFRDVQSRGFLTFSSFTLAVDPLKPNEPPRPVPAITGNALADLLFGVPVFTGGAKLDNPQHLRAESYNFFANDSYRLRRNLTLSAGLRYEYNDPGVDSTDRANIYDLASGKLVPVGKNGTPRAGYAADKNNFAPRLGLAWTIKNNTVVRTGYGIYYDQSPLAPSEGLYFSAPYFTLNFYFPLQQFPLFVNNPFPSNFPFALPSSASAFQRDLRTPYVQHWNLGLQQQLGNSRVLEVAYVGSKGTKLLAARDVNQPRPGPRLPNPLIPYLRPNPQFEDILLQESSASSSYHSLQSRLQQRLSAGLSLLASYTWSKSIDNASGFFNSAADPNFPQDSFNLRAERGRSNFDIGHRFSLSYSYDLPFGKDKLFGGWQTFGVLVLQGGRPLTVALLSDIDNSNTGRANLGFGANDRPLLIGNARLDNPTPERWFNTSAFSFSRPGTFGNSGRNILDGPGYQNVNFSLVKNTAIREKLNLQFRAEFFNLFNHTNFDLPDNFLGSPSFGSIRSANSPRRVQFGLKLLF